MLCNPILRTFALSLPFLAAADLAIAQGNLLPVTPPSVGLPFGFHPRLAELRTLFNSKQTAVLANVGTLIRPTTRTQFRAL